MKLVSCVRVEERAKKPTLGIAWHIGRVQGCGTCKQMALVDQLAIRDGLVVLMWHLMDVSVLTRAEQLFK